MNSPVHRSFLAHFALGFFVLVSLLLGVVTWMDPFRNLGFPWKSPFIFDRNPAYKRFTLLEKAESVTDVVIGSSTSEAFVPRVLKERYGVNAFAANSGGATLPSRYLMIRHALAVQPKLKRILYTADLFEFGPPKLETGIYFQPEMMKFMEADLASVSRPEWTARFDDFFSLLVIDRSFRTLKDVLAARAGRYQSAYFPDGSTSQSMIGGRGGDTIDKRALAAAVAFDSLYGDMKQLDPRAVRIYERLIELMERHPEVTLHLVIAPFHEAFFNHFKDRFAKTGIYERWRAFLHSLARPNVIVHDFSYPEYLKKGVTPEDRYWQDGTHFTSEAMLLMAERIYGTK